MKLAILRPERIACVVAAGALVDMYDRVRDTQYMFVSTVRAREVERLYFGPSNERLKAWSPAAFAADVNRPALVVTFRDTASFYTSDPTPGFVRKLKATRHPPHVVEESIQSALPERNARISLATEKFLAEHLPLPPR